MAVELLFLGAPITLYWLFGLTVLSFATFQDHSSAAALLLMFLLAVGVPIAALWRLSLGFILKKSRELVGVLPVWWMIGKIGLLIVIVGGTTELAFALKFTSLQILLFGLPLLIPGVHLLYELAKVKQPANNSLQPTDSTSS